MGGKISNFMKRSNRDKLSTIKRKLLEIKVVSKVRNRFEIAKQRAYINKNMKQLNLKRLNELKDFKDVYSIEPLVSVLMPVYNHASVVSEALQSILNQTYKNIEVIILDDGSKDNLLEILEKFSYDTRLKIYTQENQKLPNALSNLHSLATGKYITWTSADNIMHKDMIQILVNNLMKNPDVALVYADVEVIDKNSKYFFGNYRDMDRDNNLAQIIRLCRYPETLSIESDNYVNACFLYRKDSSDTLGGIYANDTLGAEDYDYWLRIAKSGKIMHVKNEYPLYQYRVHKNTMSEDLISNKLEKHIRNINKLFEFEQKRKEYTEKRSYINVDLAKNSKYIENIKNCIDKYPCFSNIYDDKITDKVINVTDNENTTGINILIENNKYILKENDKKILETTIGMNLNKLALKTRKFNDNTLKNSMKTVGIHADLTNIDTVSLSKDVLDNKNVLFVMIDTGYTKDIEDIKEKNNLNNLIYIKEKEFGKMYNEYLKFDMVYIPKFKNSSEIINIVISAYLMGKYTIYNEAYIDLLSTIPYTIPYGVSYDFNVSKDLVIKEDEYDILDKYVEEYSTLGRFNYIVKQFNSFTQEKYINRPKFENDNILRKPFSEVKKKLKN